MKQLQKKMKKIFTKTNLLRHELSRANVEEKYKRMKSLESVHKIMGQRPIFVRLDGCNFSSFTKTFCKPFDVNIHKALVMASTDVMGVYNPKTAYICSDEVTFIFQEKRAMDKEQLPFQILHGGRIQKITSIFASMLSVRFFHHLHKLLINDNQQQKAIDLINDIPHFDARVVQLPNDEEAYINIEWRQMDCIRNSKNLLARTYYSHTQTQKQSANKLMEGLQREKGIAWADFPSEYKYGTFIKRQKYLKEGLDPRNNQSKQTVRIRHEAKSFCLRDDQETRKLLLADFWNDEIQKI